MSHVAFSKPESILYVFVDKSGNLDFSGRGTDHFLISAVFTTDPCRSAAALQKLRYELLAGGSEQLEFHATENSRGTRRQVIECIKSIDCISVHTIWVNKHYAHPRLHEPVAFFGLFANALAKWVMKTVGSEHKKVVINFDSVLTKKQQSIFLSSLKSSLNTLGKPYRIAFMPVKSDLNGQIADYFAWSQFRRLESGDTSPSEELSSVKHTTFNMFQTGHTRYW